MKTDKAIIQLPVVDEIKKTVHAVRLSIIQVNTYIELGYKVTITQPVILEEVS